MIRALATLMGFAAAAVLLALAPNAGDLTGDTLWYVAGVWAAAGLVAGVFYQAGGVRRPGTRLNLPMLFLAWLPWSLLAAGAIVQLAEPGGDVARLYRDVLPDTWLAHWAIGDVRAGLRQRPAAGVLADRAARRGQPHRHGGRGRRAPVDEEPTSLPLPVVEPAPAPAPASRTVVAQDATDLTSSRMPRRRARRGRARRGRARAGRDDRDAAARDEARMARTAPE